jgi:hypothetical protein
MCKTFLKSNFHGTRGRLHLLRLATLGFIGVLIICATFLFLHEKDSHYRNKAAKFLPGDVEFMMNDFNYQCELEKGTIEITGKKIIRRGKRFMAVRSTIMKANMFTDIEGSYTIGHTVVAFRATNAEWDLNLDKPLFLKKRVELTVNGQTYKDIDLAEIFFQKGVIEVHGRQRSRINL